MTSPTEHLERLYASDPDPWNFSASPYERAKYEATLAALDRDRYASALEIGCSIGIFSNLLAGRCDRLLCLDAVEAPLAAARRNCPHAHVRFARALAPADWPEGRFDLIVLSEVLYYLAPEAIDAVAALARAALVPGGTVLLVDYLGETGTAIGGDAAADRFVAAFRGAFGASPAGVRTGSYRIDRLSA